jgi:PhnB protein
MPVKPYLFFNGQCEEAAAYYKEVFGAEVTFIMRFCDSPEPLPPGAVPPGSENKVMHMAMRVGGSEILASDGGCQTSARPEGFSLVYSVQSEHEAEKLFGLLGDGGRIEMPLGKTFFAPSFGIVSDRFGVSWMIIAEPEG